MISPVTKIGWVCKVHLFTHDFCDIKVASLNGFIQKKFNSQNNIGDVCKYIFMLKNYSIPLPANDSRL